MLGEKAKPNPALGYDETAARDHLLAAMRVASIRLLLTKLDLDSIGTALKGGFISTEEARDWLADVGALPLIDAALGGRNEQ
jgi:small ligand-binding sensory domain FIST